MSFLTRSKPSIPESPSSYFASRHENRDRTLLTEANHQTRDGIMGGLQNFRDDLRKQLSSKLTRNLKSIDVAATGAPNDFRTPLSAKNMVATPSNRPNSYAREQDGLFSAKTSQIRTDLKKELTRRGEESSPFRQSPTNKNSDILGIVGKTRDTQRNSAIIKEIKSLARGSPVRRNESPKNPERSTFEMKPLDYFKTVKKGSEQKSYLEPKVKQGAIRQKDLREDIRDILNSGRIGRPESSKPNGEGRTRGNLGPSRIETGYTSPTLALETSSSMKNTLTENLKNSRVFGRSSYGYEVGRTNKTEWETQSIVKQRSGLDLRSMNITNPTRDSPRGRESFSVFKLESGNRERDSYKRENLISDQLTVQKLFDLQDLFYNASEGGFDQLSSEYIEELIKLSSVIMHRVKNSSYYNKI